LKPDRFCISFYGWAKADVFLAAWREAGFRPVGHFVWTKGYTSRTGYTQGRHECAYLLAKGNPCTLERSPPDVLPWRYSGNRLHPTHKPVESLKPLIAACELGRSFIGIEQDARYHRLAIERLSAVDARHVA
jgi:site-specific DNA-methyltransferase (adenine-specific)